MWIESHEIKFSWNQIWKKLLCEMYPYLLFYSRPFPFKDFMLQCDMSTECRLFMIFFSWLSRKTLSPLRGRKSSCRCLKNLLQSHIFDFSPSWQMSDLLKYFTISTIRIIKKFTWLNTTYNTNSNFIFFPLKMTLFLNYSKEHKIFSY